MGELERLRRMALEIFFEAVRAGAPREAIMRNLELEGRLLRVGGIGYSLREFKNLWVIGAGKAGASMARAMEEILGEYISGGFVIVKYGHQEHLQKIIIKEAGHPIPDEAGLTATQELIKFVEKFDEKDLVFNLISGGGSSLLVAPVEGISLQDKQITTELMLKSGMNIEEINAVRKHLSRVKGGGLAKLLAGTTVVSLILSDCIGDSVSVIASGPTAPDPSTYQDALQALKFYGILDKVPDSVRKHLELGFTGKILETPKPGDSVFSKVQNIIIGSNLMSIKSAKEYAEKMGLNTVILSSAIQGDVRELAKFYGAIFKEVLKSGNPVSAPACIIAGGEPTVKVSGRGKGGRNQELALAVAMEIQGLHDAVFLSAGTDGTDGPTDSAGAIVDGETISRAQLKNMEAKDYLKKNDSYNFFRPLGDLVITGPTGTNVMDIHILIIGEIQIPLFGNMKIPS